MSLSTYADLTSAVNSFGMWPTAPISTFVALAEEAIRPVLKHRLMEMKTTLSAAAGAYPTLPADFQEARRIDYLGIPLQPLSFQNDGTYRPGVFGYVISGSSLEVKPAPTTDYTVDLYYYQRLPALSDAVQTNWLMTNFPSVYLRATLAQLYHWAKDTEAEAAEKELLGEALTVLAKDHSRTTAYGNTIIEELPSW